MYIINYIHMSSDWTVTFSRKQGSNPYYFEYSAHIDKETKDMTVFTPTYFYQSNIGDKISDVLVNSVLTAPDRIDPNTKKFTLIYPTWITTLERQISPFNAKKKRAAKSKSKSRRKSRSPRRV